MRDAQRPAAAASPGRTCARCAAAPASRPAGALQPPAPAGPRPPTCPTVTQRPARSARPSTRNAGAGSAAAGQAGQPDDAAAPRCPGSGTARRPGQPAGQRVRVARRRPSWLVPRSASKSVVGTVVMDADLDVVEERRAVLAEQEQRHQPPRRPDEHGRDQPPAQAAPARPGVAVSSHRHAPAGSPRRRRGVDAAARRDGQRRDRGRPARRAAARRRCTSGSSTHGSSARAASVEIGPSSVSIRGARA